MMRSPALATTELGQAYGVFSLVSTIARSFHSMVLLYDMDRRRAELERGGQGKSLRTDLFAFDGNRLNHKGTNQPPDYQNGHHPMYDWHRLMCDVASRMSLCTCAGTSSTDAKQDKDNDDWKSRTQSKWQWWLQQARTCL